MIFIFAESGQRPAVRFLLVNIRLYSDQLIFARADAELFCMLERHAPVGRRRGAVKMVAVVIDDAVVMVRALGDQIVAEN